MQATLICGIHFNSASVIFFFSFSVLQSKQIGQKIRASLNAPQPQLKSPDSLKTVSTGQNAHRRSSLCSGGNNKNTQVVFNPTTP